MFDATKGGNESIKVTSHELAPRITVATAQVPQLQVLFDGLTLPHTIHSTDEDQLKMITFGPDVTADEVQRILDEID